MQRAFGFGRRVHSLQRRFGHEPVHFIGHADVVQLNAPLNSDLLSLRHQGISGVSAQFDLEGGDVAARCRQRVSTLEVEKVLFAMNVGGPEDDLLDAVAFGAKDVLEERAGGGVVNRPVDEPVVEIVISAETLRVLILPRSWAVGDHQVVWRRNLGCDFAA